MFPLAPRDKIPANGHGFKEATTDPAAIRCWWDRWPDANIGLATGQASGLFVLDLDGPQGEDSIASLVYGYGDLTWFSISTMEATTGKGRHLYFLTRIPNREGLVVDQPIRSRTRLWPGLDVRGDGGYVVMPPSIHPSGSRYEWRNPYGPTLPAAWLVDLINDTFPGEVKKPARKPAEDNNVVGLGPRRYLHVPSVLKDHVETDSRRLRAAKTTVQRISDLQAGERNAGLFRHARGLRTMCRSEEEWQAWREEVLTAVPIDPIGAADAFTYDEAVKVLNQAERYGELGTWQPASAYRPPAVNRRRG